MNDETAHDLYQKKEDDLAGKNCCQSHQPESSFEKGNSSKNSMMRMYFKEVSKRPKLSPQDTIELKKQIIKLENLLKSNNGKKADIISLRIKELKDLFISSHLPMVIAIAKKFFGKEGFDPLDIIQEGNIGLMKAMEKFDPERNIHFSTYATWWILRYIQRSFANSSKIIRIPVYMVELISRYNKVHDNLSQTNKCEPSDEQLADGMGVKIKCVKKVKSVIMTSQVEYFNAIDPEESEEKSVSDLLPRKGSSLESKIILNNYKELIESKLENLEPRERDVIILRNGLRGEAPRTLKEVGEMLGGFTREYIRQVEKRATNKLGLPMMKKYIMSQK